MPKLDGLVIVRKGESFQGFLVPFAAREIGGCIEQGFVESNLALKRVAESAIHHPLDVESQYEYTSTRIEKHEQ